MKISINIITYGREKEFLSTLEDICKYRGKNLEVLILNNNIEDRLKNQMEEIFKNKNIVLRYYHLGKNLGVALGRNYLIERSLGEYIVTLDDDVYIENINDLLEKVEKYLKVEKIGALAFNIKNYYSKKPLSHEIPHGNKKLDFNKNLETYYYIGAGHCIRKSTYERVGMYPKDLGIYGGEERDLSFRILGEDLEILYCSDIVIYHKVSPEGRMSLERENFYRYRNQLMVLNRYMNFIPRWSSNILWSLFYYLKKGGKIQYIFQVLREVNGLERYPLEKRKKIEKKIKSLKGRIYY
ncbi:MAG: glycosyltransferase family 2 protein [Cetobacterium sp.]|uniref:glycosyltransferase family 2 protein n=1 Tax=Cetobacterium sp. TaxID=2071632 RepID=UPI003F3549DE